MAQPTQIAAPSANSSQLRTEILEPRRINWLKVGFMLLALFGLAGAIAIVVAPELVTRFANRPSNPAPSTVPPVPATPASTPLSSGSLIRLDAQPPSVPLLKNVGQPTETVSEFVGRMPPGTVLQILGRQQLSADPTAWLKLKVCTVGTLPPDTKLPNPVKVGNIGWQRESAIASFTPVDSNSDQIGACAASAESAKENPLPTP